MPNFSFDVTIYGGDASLVPGLEQWLSAFMKDRVFRYCPPLETTAKVCCEQAQSALHLCKLCTELELTDR